MTGVLIKRKFGHRRDPGDTVGRLDLSCPNPGTSRGLGEAGTDPPHPCRGGGSAHTAIRDFGPQGVRE